MKEISATAAARGFSALLDAVEHDGETFLLTRAGRAVARIEPAAGCSGATLKDLLRRHDVDDDWAGEIAVMRADLPAQERAWHD